MSSGKVKASQLWGKSKEDLKSQLEELKHEYTLLGTQRVIAASNAKIFKLHQVSKSIARVLTILNAKQRAQLRAAYAKKKYIPLDLRPKLTRALRRKLSPTDAKRMTDRQRKRMKHFPQRVFAVKAT